MMNDSSREQPLVVAIDGPAGAGKSTVAREVARRLGLPYLDTGAIYRTVALQAMREGVDWDDAEGVTAIARQMVTRGSLRFDNQPDGQHVWLGDEDVSKAIRTPEVSQGASRVSVHPGVRQALLEMQRAIASREGVVAEGRDMGTVVFPGAEAKFFLTASVRERAMRRYLQLKESGVEASLEQLEREVEERDRRDMEREVAPLRKAPDAVQVDTSGLTAEQVVDRIVEHVRKIRSDPK